MDAVSVKVYGHSGFGFWESKEVDEVCKFLMDYNIDFPLLSDVTPREARGPPPPPPSSPESGSGKRMTERYNVGENEEDEFLLLETGMENSLSFKKMIVQHDNTTRFLCQHEYIPIRSTSASLMEVDKDLNISSDIDGVTIEWKNLAGTSQAFHHLFLLPRGSQSLKKVYSLLRKHEHLAKYNDVSRNILKECVGAPLLSDSGWEYVLCLLPEFDNQVPYQKDVIRITTEKWIREVRAGMQRMFLEAIPGGDIRDTIDKNNVNDLRQMFILPGDIVQVLQMFQTCVDNVVAPQGFRRCIFSYRFGEKHRGQVHLPITDYEAVNRICVHVGITIGFTEESESLLWSRTGLETVIGNRGTLSTASGLIECANFQSHLDGRALQVSGKLKQVSKYPESISFVQLYSDVPHCYPKTRYHPISAAIIFPDGMRSASESLLTEARQYLSVLRSNFIKMTRSVCRMEFVSALPKVSCSVNGDEMVNMDAVISLITEHALFVPFCTSHFMESLQNIGLTLCEQLGTNLEQFKRTSASEIVWQSYQYELAVEKLLWGHPLSLQSREHAINLGPGVEYPSRCASDQFGFLKLENKFMCCVDEHSTPPLTIYSGSECVRKQLQKVFGFWDRISASELVLGRCLIQVLLQDLFDVGLVFARLGTFTASLKEGGHSMRIVGVISKTQLAKQLTNIKKCKFPMVYLHVLKMVRKGNKDVEKTLTKGIEEMQLRYFPAFRNADEHRNPGMYWHFTYGVWVVKDLSTCNCTDIRADLLCALVLNELESRELCYTRSLNGTNECFPWVRDSLRKLQELNLEENLLVAVMTFVTCVAFLEKGQFVRYDKLKRLVDEMPLTQRRLRDLEIQGQFLLNNMNIFKVWRLHWSIPRQSSKLVTLPTPERTVEKRVRQDSEERSAELDIADYIDETSYENQGNTRKIVTRPTVRHLPANTVVRWSPQELAMLHKVHESAKDGEPLTVLYARYQNECRLLAIPDRAFTAFRLKYRRLKMTETSAVVGEIVNEMLNEVVRQGEDIILMYQKGHMSPPGKCSFYLPGLQGSNSSAHGRPESSSTCVCQRCQVLRRRSIEAVPEVQCRDDVQCPLKRCLFNIIAESCAMCDTELDTKLMLQHIRKDLCEAVEEVDKRLDNDVYW